MTISENGQAPLLAVQRLALQRGREWLLRDLDFSIRPGEALWLRGRNGCGKTSLLRVLAGLADPDDGRVARGAAASVLYLGHVNGLKDDLSALESLQFLARLHGGDARPASLTAALRRLGVQPRSHLPVRALSQGQRRRVALARLALTPSPDLWLLDEPFDALDDEGIRVVHELIAEQLARRGSVILTSHLPVALGPGMLRELSLSGSAGHA